MENFFVQKEGILKGNGAYEHLIFLYIATKGFEVFHALFRFFPVVEQKTSSFSRKERDASAIITT